MNHAHRTSYSSERFESFERAQIASSWDEFQTRTLRGGHGENHEAAPVSGDFAVALGGELHRDMPWIEATRYNELLRLQLINPARLRLGRSALAGTVTLQMGEALGYGRNHNGDLPDYVSRSHTSITNSLISAGQTFALVENYSANGTTLFRTRKDEQGYRPRFNNFRWNRYHRNEYGQDSGETEAETPPSFSPRDGRRMYDESSSEAHQENPMHETRRDTPKIDVVAEFAALHAETYGALSPADFAVAYYASISLRQEFPQPEQRRLLERTFNKQFHPDRHMHVNDVVAQQLYVLIKQELGLS